MFKELKEFLGNQGKILFWKNSFKSNLVGGTFARIIRETKKEQEMDLLDLSKGNQRNEKGIKNELEMNNNYFC